MITVLTKKMAEDLTEFMHEKGIRVRYLHSDIDTIERIEIIRDLRKGIFDVLIGINLLREGLDIPECSLVAILDADKEGFLRSETSLTQTIGRAARNINGKVILYADKITNSISNALNETERRRRKQRSYNDENNITPETISSNVDDLDYSIYEKDYYNLGIDSSIELKEEDLDKKLVVNMQQQAHVIIPQIEPYLDAHFGSYEVFSVEEPLYEDVTFLKPIERKFKGFIDLVVKTDDGTYHIIDWKTCSWGWDA